MVRQTKMNMAISQYFSHAYSLGKQVEISPPKAIFFETWTKQRQTDGQRVKYSGQQWFKDCYPGKRPQTMWGSGGIIMIMWMMMVMMMVMMVMMMMICYTPVMLITKP